MENPTNPTNTPGDTQPRPIGYWLRAADRLISREFAAAFENEGVTRRDWMILNVLDGTTPAPQLADRLQRGGKKLRRLAERGWVAEVDGSWTLTDDGRAAKARLSEVVDGIRAKVAGAVSDEDYATTVASLEAIVHELGGDENTPLPLGGRGFGRRGFGGRGFGRRGFGPGFGPVPGFGGPGFRPGFGPVPGFGPGPGERGFGPRFGEPGHGPHTDGCDGHRRRGGLHARHGHGENAYERGFDAGFARGRAERTA